MAVTEEYGRDEDIFFYSRTDEKEVVAALLHDLLKGRRLKHALDAGAGPGALAEHLAQHADRLTLLDILEEYRVPLERKFPGSAVKIGSILDIRLDDDFDCILLSHVLYYIPASQWLALLDRLCACLRPGGLLIVILNDTAGDWWRVVEHFRARIPGALSWEYIPPAELALRLAELGPVRDIPFHFSVRFPAGPLWADFIARGILEIRDPEQLKQYRSELQGTLDWFSQQRGEAHLRYDARMLVLVRAAECLLPRPPTARSV